MALQKKKLGAHRRETPAEPAVPMQLTLFAVASGIERVRTEGSIALRVTHPMPAVHVDRVPALASFRIIFGIMGVDTTRTCTIATELKAPGGLIVFQSVGEQPPARDSAGIPRPYRTLLGFADCTDVELIEEGEYAFSVFCNDEFVQSVPVPVLAGRRRYGIDL